jgi:hypothetical protein
VELSLFGLLYLKFFTYAPELAWTSLYTEMEVLMTSLMCPKFYMGCVRIWHVT